MSDAGVVLSMAGCQLSVYGVVSPGRCGPGVQAKARSRPAKAGGTRSPPGGAFQAPRFLEAWEKIRHEYRLYPAFCVFFEDFCGVQPTLARPTSPLRAPS